MVLFDCSTWMLAGMSMHFARKPTKLSKSKTSMAVLQHNRQKISIFGNESPLEAGLECTESPVNRKSTTFRLSQWLQQLCCIHFAICHLNYFTRLCWISLLIS